MQQPGQRHLGPSRPEPACDVVEPVAPAPRRDGGDRKPGNERDAALLAIVDNVLGGAVDDVVPVLHAHDRRDLHGFGELVDGDLGEADVADLPLVLEPPQRADLVGQRHGRVDAVQLVQVDALQPQPAQAQFGLLAQVLRTAERDPVAAEVDLPALGGDHHARRVRVQRLGEQRFVVAVVVRVGGVDERHAEVDGAAGDPDRGGPVRPGPHAGEPHRAESEAVDGQVADHGGVLHGSHPAGHDS